MQKKGFFIRTFQRFQEGVQRKEEEAMESEIPANSLLGWTKRIRDPQRREERIYPPAKRPARPSHM